MRLILTVGVLCAALLIAAVTTVNAQPVKHGGGDAVTPTTLAGE